MEPTKHIADIIDKNNTFTMRVYAQYINYVLNENRNIIPMFLYQPDMKPPLVYRDWVALTLVLNYITIYSILYFVHVFHVHCLVSMKGKSIEEVMNWQGPYMEADRCQMFSNGKY